MASPWKARDPGRPWFACRDRGVVWSVHFQAPGSKQTGKQVQGSQDTCADLWAQGVQAEWMGVCPTPSHKSCLGPWLREPYHPTAFSHPPPELLGYRGHCHSLAKVSDIRSRWRRPGAGLKGGGWDQSGRHGTELMPGGGLATAARTTEQLLSALTSPSEGNRCFWDGQHTKLTGPERGLSKPLTQCYPRPARLGTLEVRTPGRCSGWG